MTVKTIAVFFDIEDGKPHVRWTEESKPESHPGKLHNGGTVRRDLRYNHMVLGDYDVHIYTAPTARESVALKTIEYAFEHGEGPFKAAMTK